MAEAAVRREWGCEPLYVREGGTMPVASVLERMLAAPAIMIPMGQSSDSPHLANERIRRVNLLKVMCDTCVPAVHAQPMREEARCLGSLYCTLHAHRATAQHK
jgi:hypothetical protein